METKRYGRYDYEELKKKAIAPSAPQIDIDTLGAWFDSYGNEYWNGEYYDVDGLRLFPIMEEIDEYGDYEITGYEFR